MDSTSQPHFEISAALLEGCAVDTSTPSWQEAESKGWDMSLVSLALKMPINERLRQHDLALAQIQSMRADFLKQYGQFGAAH